MKLSAENSLRIQAYFLSSTAKASNTTLKYLETKTKVLVHFSKTFGWILVKYKTLYGYRVSIISISGHSGMLIQLVTICQTKYL